MNSELVTTEVALNVACLTLNRPERRNALSLAMMHALSEALRNAAADHEVRAVVLQGAGPAFSAGHDLREMQSIDASDQFDELFGACVTLMQTIHNIDVPVIAKVHGVATAAGCQLVAACDLAVCTDTARFATPGVNIGLFCSTPMVPLSRAIGRKRSMEMLLTGSMIDAKTAFEWGLVNRAVAADELDGAVAQFTDAINDASRDVVALGKRAFWDQVDRTEAEAYALTAPIMSANAQLDAAHEGISAFIEKRIPQWPAGTSMDAATSS